MFEDLARYSAIVVTGPHRSGTTIAGEMIASDTGHTSLREEAFGWANEAQFIDLLQRQNVVLQAPFFAHICHMIPQWRADALVVFMMRTVGEIHASQARMVDDVGRVTGFGIAHYRLRQLHTGRIDANLVYENWEQQKLQIPNHRVVQYRSLKDHPLWVNDRSRFHFRQTR